MQTTFKACRPSVRPVAAAVAWIIAMQVPAGAAASEAAEPAAGDTAGVQEVTVTATRRTSATIDTPLAVDAISSERLRTFHVESLQDLSRLDASVTINSFGAAQQQLVIRGISSNIAATTGLYMDESPLLGGFQNNFRGDGTPGVRLIDVDHVEVLKGPQGTLFGSGSMDGTLRVITNKPDPSGLSGWVSVDAATVSNGDGYYDGSFVFNAPISGNAAVRIVGWGETGGGYIDQTLNGRTLENVNNENLKGGRITGLWKPTERLQLTGSVTYQDARVDGSQPWTPSAGAYNSLEQSLEPYSDKYLLFNVTTTYDTGFGDLIGVFTHGSNRTQQTFDSTPTNCGFGLCPPVVPQLSFVPVLAFGDTTGELRFVSRFSGPVQLVAGAYYQNDHSSFSGSAIVDNAAGYPACIDLADCQAKGLRNPGNNFTGIPVNYLEFGTIDDLDVDQRAGYAQLDWKVTDALTLTGGARYFSATLRDVTYSTQDIAPPNACNWVQGCVTTPYVTFPAAGDPASITQSKTTYNAAVLYKLATDVSLFARAASGFRIGGINTDYNPNNLPQIPLGYSPDSLWDYEGGIKAYFLDRRLYLDLTYYHIDWTNEQINAVAEGAFQYTLNAGKTRTDGLELDFTYLPVRGLSVTGAVSYNHARLAEQLPQSVTDAGNGGNAGDPVPLSPKVVASLAATYEFPISARLSGYANADVSYRDATQLGFNSTDQFYATLPPYFLADLRAGAHWGGFDAGVFVQNLGNTAAWAGLQRTTDGLRVFSPRPRTIGVNLKASF